MKTYPVLGYTASAFVLAVLVTAAVGLLSAAGPESGHLPWQYIRGVVLFTAGQAALSTVLSLVLGGGLALALARRNLPGKGLILALLNLAAVLPVIVAVLGIVTVFGRAGWLGSFAQTVGLPWTSWLYGLPGILIAHVFFNAPLAARTGWIALTAIPGEHWRLAKHLGFGSWATFRIIDWPVLSREIPRTGALIFFLCFTSFAAVLALGGGPSTATLEVAIYEAIRFDVDFGRAGLLALMQLVICCSLAWPLIRLFGTPPDAAPTGLPEERPDARSVSPLILDCLFLTVGATIVLPPLLAVFLSGLISWRVAFEPDTAAAALTSLSIAVPSAVIAMALGLGLASSTRRLRLKLQRPKLADGIGLLAMAILILPSFAVAAGLFVSLRLFLNPFSLAMPMVVLVNALTALPFVYRQIEQPLMSSEERFGRLADSLGIEGRNRLRLVDWPLLRRPAIVAFVIATALSLGDLGVITLFGSGDLITLPLLIYQYMGAYRLDAAASVSLLTAVAVLGLFWIGHILGGPGRPKQP